MVNMRSAQSGETSDLTARAAIRNAALALFAEHGPDAVSVRQIATEAGVSPALVLHHFGSKAGLREAVDAHARAAFDEVMTSAGPEEVGQALAGGDGGSLAQAFSAVFPPGSPLPAYLRRLLLSGDPAGIELFRVWFEGTRGLLAQMEALGMASSTRDPQVRAAFLLANDLALVLLRPALRDVLGFDPMEPAGMRRWAAEVTTVYREGLWSAPPGAGPDSAPPDTDTDSGPAAREGS